MKEVWKDIPGYEGIAKASSLGRIKVVYGGLSRIYESVDNDYHCVDIVGVRKRIHQWVALAFIPNPDNKVTVNHIDGNKGNNKPSNLEWNTYKENNEHALRMGLNDLNVPGGKAETRRLKTVSMPVVLYSDKIYVFYSLQSISRYINEDINKIKKMNNVHVYPRGTEIENISELEGVSYEIIH